MKTFMKHEHKIYLKRNSVKKTIRELDNEITIQSDENRKTKLRFK